MFNHLPNTFKFAVEHGSIEVIDFLIRTDADRYALNTHLESVMIAASWSSLLMFE